MAIGSLRDALGWNCRQPGRVPGFRPVELGGQSENTMLRLFIVGQFDAEASAEPAAE